MKLTNGKSTLSLSPALVMLGLFAVSADHSRAQLINGNFATGDFTGWTIFDTVGGPTGYGIESGGSSLAQVTQFDTAGAGTPQNSAEFEVGEVSGIVGGGGLGQGAGITQNVVLGAGQLSIFLNIAALSPGNNADGGTFELLLDGNVIASDALGGIGYNQTIRSTLSYSGSIGAGSHAIAIDIRRGYGCEYSDSPYEFLSNITLGGTAVPEPGTYGVLTALGGLLYGIKLTRPHPVKG